MGISDAAWKRYQSKIDAEQKGARVRRHRDELTAVKIAGTLAGQGFFERANQPAKIGKAGRLER